jgi:adenylate kinase family enzyme
VAEALGQRILVLGCSGSGKSTLAQALGPRLGLPVQYLDKLLWLPGWGVRDRVEADAALQDAVNEERWVLDGCLRGQLPIAVPAADTVIFLDFGRWRCLLRVWARIWKSWGQVRPEMAPDCPEQIDW